MAKVEGMIPFLIRWEVGILRREDETLEDLFDRAKVSKGGFVHDKDDLGGATVVGVTFGTYASYCYKRGYPTPTIERLKSIKYETWKDILDTLFWARIKGSQIENQNIANAVIDFNWNAGLNAIKVLQRILKVNADGLVGPKTIVAINTYPDQKELFAKYKTGRLNYYEDIVRRRPVNAKFLKGWKNRTESLKWEECLCI